MLLRHTEFISRVSISAARAFYQELQDVLHRLGENPFQFPLEGDANLPEGQYRKALFAKWYKAVFAVDGQTVYLDAVVDCWMDNRNPYKTSV